MDDPWGKSSEASEDSFAKFKGSNVFGAQSSFDDNFGSRYIEKLPDSEEYLSRLERKLAKVQGKKRPASSSAVTTGPSSRDLLRSLTALRSDRMREFLSTEKPLDDASISNHVMSLHNSLSEINPENDPLYSSWLMHRLFPDRQALSEEELASLLRFDVLARLNDQLCATPGSEDVSNQADSTAVSPPQDPPSN